MQAHFLIRAGGIISVTLFPLALLVWNWPSIAHCYRYIDDSIGAGGEHEDVAPTHGIPIENNIISDVDLPAEASCNSPPSRVAVLTVIGQSSTRFMSPPSGAQTGGA